MDSKADRARRPAPIKHIGNESGEGHAPVLIDGSHRPAAKQELLVHYVCPVMERPTEAAPPPYELVKIWLTAAKD